MLWKFGTAWFSETKLSNMPLNYDDIVRLEFGTLQKIVELGIGEKTIVQIKKGDVYPLKLRVVHNRKPFDLPLGFNVPIKDWDAKGQKVKSSCQVIENVTRFNALLNKEKAKIQDVLVKLQAAGGINSTCFIGSLTA
jgi:hypothetical protein